MPSLTGEELAAALKVLQTLAFCPALLTSGDPRCAEVRRLASRLIHAARGQDRREVRQRDRDLLDRTGIRSPSSDATTDEAHPGRRTEPAASVLRL